MLRIEGGIHMYQQTTLPLFQRIGQDIWRHLPMDCRQQALALYGHLTARAVHRNVKGITPQGDNDETAADDIQQDQG
jgi:hypothetical protein